MRPILTDMAMLVDVEMRMNIVWAFVLYQKVIRINGRDITWYLPVTEIFLYQK